METQAAPAFVVLTSPPRISNRHRGYNWAYIDEQTPDGRACGICIPSHIKLEKGAALPKDQIVFNPEMGASVYVERSQPAPEAGDAVPDLPAAGWESHPHSVTVQPKPGQYGMRGPAHRRQQLAEAQSIVQQLPNDYIEQLELAARGYLYIAKRIGSQEIPRPEIAKSLAITVLIQYFKKQGALPADFDEEDMALLH